MEALEGLQAAQSQLIKRGVRQELAHKTAWSSKEGTVEYVSHSLRAFSLAEQLI